MKIVAQAGVQHAAVWSRAARQLPQQLPQHLPVGMVWVLVALVSLVLVLAQPAVALAHTDADVHAHHHVAPFTQRSQVAYSVPDVRLVRDDGTAVKLPAELDDGRLVVLSFIYTTCTTVCPVTSQVLSELQAQLGANRSKVHLMSISIDPEQDTPSRLHDYASRFGAGPGWQHYTGTLEASRAAQRAFGVYRGDKMDHAPVILLRTAPGAAWVRIDGFAMPDQLMAELSPALSR